jgi:hypothetical protein
VIDVASDVNFDCHFGTDVAAMVMVYVITNPDGFLLLTVLRQLDLNRSLFKWLQQSTY